ncbi:uncharacterized protein LOC130670436 [Microplitis mediator]|uniref:uncharacterized protein LOC130670436 n=1 Tax=Microplitis mediator TaxID=375433 RepID=UPI0025551C2F|nr:uncharacterized protein LOC130670436 [Microplitis mediator]
MTQHTRRSVLESTPKTPPSPGSKISLSSLQHIRRSVHENTPRTPLLSGSRINSSSQQHTRRSVHENTPRTPLSSGSRINSSSQQHTRRSVHVSRPYASRSRQSAPQHFNNARSTSSESGDSSSSIHSSRSSSPSSPSDFNDIVNMSQLQHGLKLFRKKIVSDVKKVLLKNNLGRPSTDNNGKVEIKGISLDAKNFSRALSAKKMSLRARRLMRAYWTENERDRLITRKNKKFPNALIVSSRNYNDFINLCYALQRTRFFKHTKKHNPEHNIYRWVTDFLKNDRFARKKQNKNSEIFPNRQQRAKPI